MHSISVGTVTSYGLDYPGSGFRFPVGVGNFPHRIQTGSGVHPASYTISTGGSFPGVKRPGGEAEQSLPTAEVKNA
jgi:hypothetical protein